MSDATTAVLAAIASSSTMPNDSPPSAGAQNTVAARSRRAFSSSEMRPIHSMPGTPRRRSASVSGPSPATHNTPGMR